jgi:murein tripeptide amidase MpaA
MMQGFLKHLLGNSIQAQELRKRCIFKIIPMINVDGVIIGNYRTSMSGNDLNRVYDNPDDKLHPEVCAIKELVS